MWNLKKLNSEKQSIEWWLPETGEYEKWVDTLQRVQTSSNKINKLWGSNILHGNYSE